MLGAGRQPCTLQLRLSLGVCAASLELCYFAMRGITSSVSKVKDLRLKGAAMR